MDPATTSLLVLAVAVALFLWNRLPVSVVAVATALSLYATGVLDAGQALAGFGDPIVVFVASLFVVSEALDATGVTTWAGRALTDRAGGKRSVLVAVMALAGVLTAVVSPNGSVAALLPMVVVVAARGRHPASQMVMPLAFAAHAGSLLALSGSPVNVIVSDAAAEAGSGPFGFFEFAVLGVPLLVVTVALCTLLGPRLLPATGGGASLTDLSRHTRTLSGHYALQDGFYRLRVRGGSPLEGVRLPDGDPADLSVLGVQTSDGVAAPARHVLAAGDAIVVTGSAVAVLDFAASRQLDVGLRPVTADTMLTRDTGIVEVVVPPRSPLVGEHVFAGMVRPGGIVILAARHHGRELARGTVLTEGDSLLLHGRWAAIDALVDDRDVLVVDSPDLVRRQAGPLGLRAKEALAVVAVMVVLLTTGVVPPAVAGLAAAAALVALRVVSAQHAYRAVSWETVVLLGGMIPLSTAIATSGAADLLAGALLDVVGDLSPYVLLLVVFAVTAALGQVVSNTATVLIVVPVAVAAAADAGVAVEPVLMTVAVAGASAFLTPIATPANMMVMGAGGYRFGDYWRLGGVVLVAWLAVVLLIVPVVWPLR
ncbi:SLC13 family permease [Georgenia yuyongxinii]|uniref:SLC13 family permease n=1 Tax=Georgenia yuyongxinii TaxID=2589797 RepID=A0A552WMS5_9MICO|nr:SLC13 family permease [Georgenia yuyongxinii]TRW44081.1 SLC13 family permease [Georgenia yuyongxinii]